MANATQQGQDRPDRPYETENIFLDDYAKTLVVSQAHLGAALTEVVAASIEYFAGLAPRKQDGFIRSRLASKAGQWRTNKNVRLRTEDRDRANAICRTFVHVTRIVIIGAAIDAFARAPMDRQKEVFHKRHARRHEPVPA